MTINTNYFNRSAREEMLKYIPANAEKILEVGCGEGLFLDLLTRAGKESWGLEINAEAAAEAQKFNGLNQQIMQLVLNKSTDLTLIQNLQTEIFSMFSQVAVFSSIGYLIAMLCLQGFLIAKFGQSLGKKVTKIKIVTID